MYCSKQGLCTADTDVDHIEAAAAEDAPAPADAADNEPVAPGRFAMQVCTVKAQVLCQVA